MQTKADGGYIFVYFMRTSLTIGLYCYEWAPAIHNSNCKLETTVYVCVAVCVCACMSICLCIRVCVYC